MNNIHKIDLHTFRNIARNIIYVKYVDGYVDYCHEIKKLIELKSNVIPDPYKYYSENKSDSYQKMQLLQEIDDRYNKYVDFLYDRINYITEIKYSHFIKSTDTVNIYLYNSLYHNLNGPALITDDMDIYFINGVKLTKDKWQSHPLMRLNKIKKIKGKN